MASPKFDRLVRFVSSSNGIQLGELPKDHPWDKDLTGLEIAVYHGTSPLDENLKLSGQTAVVKEVLSPFASVPYIYGVGLNYRRHAEEAGAPIPAYPKSFVKYSDALAGPYQDVTVHPVAQEGLDYEGELVFIMGHDVKNFPRGQNALEHVLAYTVGNDLSSRPWQDAKTGGPASNYAKSFDRFCPLGPVLVSSNVIPDPAKLTLRTHVNGEKRQESGIDDLIFTVSDIIWYFSQGRTLRRGSVIMTGTPSGVGSFQQGAPKFLKDGDFVDIEIEGIGHIRNKIVFE